MLLPLTLTLGWHPNSVKENIMAKDKIKYVPLHERLQVNTEALDAVRAKDEELTDLFRGVFESESGQRLLGHWVDKYIGHVPHAQATTNEIMFLHGQSYVVHEILQHMRKEKQL